MKFTCQTLRFKINIHVELKIVIFEYHSFDDIFKKIIFENRFENDDEKKIKKIKI